MADQEKQAQAFYEGAAALKAKMSFDGSPYAGNAQDALQLADYWQQGYAYAKRRAAGQINRARRSRAAHYAF